MACQTTERDTTPVHVHNGVSLRLRGEHLQLGHKLRHRVVPVRVARLGEKRQNREDLGQTPEAVYRVRADGEIPRLVVAEEIFCGVVVLP